MKNITLHKIAFLSLFFLLVLAACEDVVDVDLNEQDIDLISVEAYINNGESDNILVKIERTLPVTTADQNPLINGALVEISDDLPVPNKVVLVENENPGIYYLPDDSDFVPVTGRTYKLTITTPEGIVISGEDYLQEVEPLDSVKINLSARGNYEYLAVFINSQETPGEGHYYKWDIFKNGELLNKSENMAFVSDELVEGNYVYDFEIFTDFPPTDDEDARELHLGDSIFVKQLSISKSAYDFYTGMVNQAFTGSPFSVPPANVPGNLSSSDGKKVMGFFTARDVSVGELMVIDSSNYTPLYPDINF